MSDPTNSEATPIKNPCVVSVPITLEVPLSVKPIVTSTPPNCGESSNGHGTPDLEELNPNPEPVMN